MIIRTNIDPAGIWRIWALAAACGLGTVTASTAAANLEVTVGDQAGAAVLGAVVELRPVSAAASAAIAEAANGEMAQQHQAFSPHVLVVREGAAVTFPNRDPFHHHIYSFSEAKTFEIELYSRGEVPKVVFPKVGIVALGCNIHDNMQGYIYVSAAPHFDSTTDNGIVVFASIAAGEWAVEVWHPRAKQRVSTTVTVAHDEGRPKMVAVQIELEMRRLDELELLEAGGYD